MECCEPFPVDDSCLPPDWPTDPDVIHQIMCMASKLLRAASAYTVGLCRYTVRPCQPEKRSPCQDICGCSALCMIRIGGRIHKVDEIWIDCEQLDPALWTLYDSNLIVFAEGVCPPRCQDLSLPLGSPGTWGITYTEGRKPDALASRAATALAVQLLRECADACRTNMRGLTATQVEGESRTFDTERGGAPIAGLPEVDDWLAVVNPYGAKRQALWLDPDAPPEYRQREKGRPNVRLPDVPFDQRIAATPHRPRR